MPATARVARLVRAYGLVDREERHPVLAPRVSAVRMRVLRARIAAVLPQLSREETAAYYAAVRRFRDLDHG